MTNHKPLFIPLKTEFYDAFASGEKRVEYRRYGPRWNDDKIRAGREVVLSKGYGKQNRLRGVVVAVTIDHHPEHLPGWAECYGSEPAMATCIEIEVRNDQP